MQVKNSFVLYTDYMQHIEMLSMEQRGILFTAIMAYASGQTPNIDGMEAMAFSFIKAQMDRDAENYNKTVAARREAGRRGGIAKAESVKQSVANVANAKRAKKEVANLADNDTVTDNDKRFVPPTLQEIEFYCRESGNTIDAAKFIDFYKSKGWMVGKNKMKDWKAAVRNWKRSEVPPKQEKKPANKFHNFEQREYDYDALLEQINNNQ